MIRRIHLGLPFWGFDGWQGSVYTRDSRAADFLRQYGRVFNAVEGNTTFYAEPSVATVARWHAESPPDFRFCFKLPRAITHDARLRDVRDATRAFLDRIAPLADRMGPVMIQLPPDFGSSELARLEGFLEELPEGQCPTRIIVTSPGHYRASFELPRRLDPSLRLEEAVLGVFGRPGILELA